MIIMLLPILAMGQINLNDNTVKINSSGILTSSGNITIPVIKTATDTLLKTDAFVEASGDIILTLPDVTAADNGLTITIKNVGTYTDYVSVAGYSGIKIDAVDTSRLTRWVGKTYVVKDTNWIVKEKNVRTDNIFDVSETGSFTTIAEVMVFLGEHMKDPSVVRLGGNNYTIANTIDVNLPYPLTIEGISYGETTISAATGLLGKPMFRCQTDCYFKMITFDATALATYGTHAGEDCIRFLGEDTYNEVKDFSMDGFWNGIIDSTQAEIWIQEGDMRNIKDAGIVITGANDSVRFRMVTTAFINCDKGVHLLKGSKAYILIDGGCEFQNGTVNDSGIVYTPATFTNIAHIYITGCTWNNTGYFIEGFDFTRADGRDANAYIDNNAGIESKSPHAGIGVQNNVTGTTISAGGTFYKAAFTNTSFYTCKFTIADNSMTYQPVNKRDIRMVVCCNIQVNQINRVIDVCIVKNGNAATKYGQMSARIPTANQPFAFSTVAYIPNVAPADYFEIWVTSANSGDVVIIQDVNWDTSSQ